MHSDILERIAYLEKYADFTDRIISKLEQELKSQHVVILNYRLRFEKLEQKLTSWKEMLQKSLMINSENIEKMSNSITWNFNRLTEHHHQIDTLSAVIKNMFQKFIDSENRDYSKEERIQHSKEWLRKLNGTDDSNAYHANTSTEGEPPEMTIINKDTGEGYKFTKPKKEQEALFDQAKIDKAFENWEKGRKGEAEPIERPSLGKKEIEKIVAKYHDCYEVEQELEQLQKENNELIAEFIPVLHRHQELLIYIKQQWSNITTGYLDQKIKELLDDIIYWEGRRKE